MPDEWIINASEFEDPMKRFDYKGLRQDMLDFVRADQLPDRSKTPWVIVTRTTQCMDFGSESEANLAMEARSQMGTGHGTESWRGNA